MNRHTFVVYSLSILACFVVSDAARLQGEGIIAGDLAKPNQFPYHVAIVANRIRICGGGIIDDEYILTAAHCVINYDGDFTGESLTVVAGTNDLDKRDTEGISIPVEKVYAHAEFSRQTYDWPSDIAILKLKQSLNVSANNNLKKLKLPTNTTETYAKKRAVIAGFGYDVMNIVYDPVNDVDRELGRSKDLKLKYIVAKIIGKKRCQEKLGVVRPVGDNHLCASAIQRDTEKPSGVCSGDSGGPLVFRKETVIGIVSTSPLGCTEAVEPAVYTRVSSFLGFIENAKKNNVTKDMRVYDF